MGIRTVLVCETQVPFVRGGAELLVRQLVEQERATVDLFQRSSPSVVFITSLETRRDVFSFNLFSVPSGSGSGFVWDRKGHIVTNFHVIRGASEARVCWLRR